MVCQPTTIKYTHYFYRLYSQLLANRQGDIDDFESLFMVPWSLHILIIDKLKNNPQKALFFVKKTIENNWGHGLLLNFISTDLYERQGNTEVEKPAIGLLICKEKNAVLARYALSGMNRPMGISEYEVTQQQLPDDLKNMLPSTDEIEAGLNRMRQDFG